MTGPVFGWEEWVALPVLGLAAVMAKIDSGARGSVLHAGGVEPYGPMAARRVRFVVNPLPEQPTVDIACDAALLGRRTVRSSNGQAETRLFIETLVRIGDLQRTVVLSLTDRARMARRMLLGREALTAFGAMVDPSQRALQPTLRTGLYAVAPDAAE